MKVHKTELERMGAAHDEARQIVESLPAEVRQRLGDVQLESDLVHEILLSGAPSEELVDNLRAQTPHRRKKTKP